MEIPGRMSVIGSINRHLPLANGGQRSIDEEQSQGTYNDVIRRVPVSENGTQVVSVAAVTTVDSVQALQPPHQRTHTNTNGFVQPLTVHDTTRGQIKRLEYPRDFFNHKTGAGPANAEEAKRLWMYRKGRRQDGLADTEEPDGEAMLIEIKEIRDSLRSFITARFWEDIRIKAKDMDLRIRGKASNLVTNADFKHHLITLENTEANQKMVFELVHLFHKDRSWLSNAIDKWLDREGMYLSEVQKPLIVDGKRTRKCANDRGGFSSVARSAKSQVVSGLMVPMLKNAGWMISLTKGQEKHNNYERRVQYNTSSFFYVVVRAEPVRCTEEMMSIVYRCCDN